VNLTTVAHLVPRLIMCTTFSRALFVLINGAGSLLGANILSRVRVTRD
jgi:hypothetical protein